MQVRLTWRKDIGGKPSVVLPMPSQSVFIARVKPASPMPPFPPTTACPPEYESRAVRSSGRDRSAWMDALA